MNAMPPPRYRIIEKGRRLITVDSRTGEALGLSGTLGADPLFGAPPVRIHEKTGRASPPAAVPSRLAEASAAAVATTAQGKPSALAPARTARAVSGRSADGGASGRWVLLALVAMAALIFLIATGLWTIFVALLILPLTRGFMVQAAKNGWPKIRAWAETGSFG